MLTVIETPMFRQYAASVWDDETREGISMLKDKQLTQFEHDLLVSLRQAQNGEYAQVHSPDEIQARKRGRPVGSKAKVHKVATTIRFDPDVLAGLRATGRGWQTRVNAAMREWLQQQG